jgi:SAM-dependent methyltransferase
VGVKTASMVERKDGEATLFIEEVLDSLISGAQVLDAGCGAGSFAHSRFPELNVVSLDIKTTAAVKESSRPVNFIRGSVECMPLSNSSFDFVVLNYVLEHVSDADATVAESSRVLKPGGLLYAALPRASSFDDRFYRFAGYFAKFALFKFGKRLEHQQRFDFALLNRTCYRNGFRLLSFCECPSGYTWMNDPRVKKFHRAFLMVLTFLKLRLKIDLFRDSNYLTLYEYVGLRGLRRVTDVCALCGMPSVRERGSQDLAWLCPYCGEKNIHG